MCVLSSSLSGRVKAEVVGHLMEGTHTRWGDKNMQNNIETGQVVWECFLPFLNIHI